MSETTLWQVRQVSVVLVAGSPIEPSSIGVSQLMSKGIVPARWAIFQEMQIPFLAETAFTNGVRIRTEGNRCIFEQNIERGVPADYAIHNAAIKYVTATELAVPYNAVGINWKLEPHNEPQSPHLTRMLLNEGCELAGFEPTSIQLDKALGDRVCKLTLTVNQNIVSVGVNYHHPMSHGGAATVIANWQECKQHLDEEIIGSLLRQSDP